MCEKRNDSWQESMIDIRIERLNAENTRLINGSYTRYHVYFELSGTPPPLWREIFERELRNLDPGQEATVDGRFLVMLSPLDEIAATRLAVLKKAVAETNGAYRKHIQEGAEVREHRNRGSDEERKVVDDLADSLDFQ
jgi:hypothetical protein